MSPADPTRLALVSGLRLGKSSHRATPAPTDNTLCVMEAVAYVAGEPWSDHPERRSYLALDWLIRTHTPAFLDLCPALAGHASALRALPEIVDVASARAVSDTVRAAYTAAYTASSAAASATASAAASAAASDAAWAAARARLAPVVAALQISALDLVDRMLAVTA